MKHPRAAVRDHPVALRASPSRGRHWRPVLSLTKGGSAVAWVGTARFVDFL